jgi:hypothetical protein
MTAEPRGEGIDWRMLPRRAPDVTLTEVVDGFVVYQPTRDRVHYLNPTAAMILELCDGSLSASDLTGFLARTFSLAAPPWVEVAACLTKLLDAGLLESGAPRMVEF